MRRVLTVQQATRLSLVTTDSTPVEVDPIDEGSLGGQAEGVIYRPGGVSNGNVLATAAEVKAAIAESNGVLRVYIDASAAPTPGTALWPDTGTGASIGVTDCLGGVEFFAFGNAGTPLPVGPMTLQIQDGASFKNLRHVDANLIIAGVCTTTPALSFSNDAFFTMRTDIGLPCLLQRNTGALVALCSIPAGVTLGLNTYGGVEMQNLAGTVGIFDLPTATSNLVWVAGGGLAVPNAPIVTGVAGSTLEIIIEDALTQLPSTAALAPSPGFAGTLTQVLGYVAPTFVYAPGSLSGAANVFTTGEQLRQAVNSIAGPKTIAIDTTGGACHLTAGTWNLNLAKFVAAQPGGNTTVSRTLTIDDGCVIATPATIDWTDVAVVNVATTAAPITMAAGDLTLSFLGFASLRSNGTKPFVDAQAGTHSASLFFFGDSLLATGATPSFQSEIAAGALLDMLPGSLMQASTLAGTGTIVLAWGQGGQISTSQPGLTTLTLVFTDGQNQVAAAGNTGTGTGTVTVTTGNIARKRSGLVLVTATITASIAASALVTAQLVRDAATNIGSPVSCTPLSAADVFSMSITFVDTLPDNANHTYKLSTTSAQNLTVNATSTQITAVEL